MARKKKTTEKTTNGSITGVLEKAQQAQELEMSEITNEIAVTGDEDIIEITEFEILGAEGQSVILDAMQSVFSNELVYNIPRASATGKISWPECKRMPHGYCPYEQRKQKHIHIKGISYQGALVAMNVYGGLDVKCDDMPLLVDFGSKPYWVVKVVCVDSSRNNTIERWQAEPMLKKSKKGAYYEDEYAFMTVQSKGIRNLILSCIPQRLKTIWIEDYVAGREPFDPQRVLQLTGRKQEALPPAEQESLPEKKETEKPKGKKKTGAEKKKTPSKPETNGAKDFKATAQMVADQLQVDFAQVIRWASEVYETQGRAMLALVNALNDEAEFGKIRTSYQNWLLSLDEPSDEEMKKSEGEEAPVEMDML